MAKTIVTINLNPPVDFSLHNEQEGYSEQKEICYNKEKSQASHKSQLLCKIVMAENAVSEHCTSLLGQKSASLG